jgi:hypothetical protein
VRIELVDCISNILYLLQMRANRKQCWIGVALGAWNDDGELVIAFIKPLA